MAARKQPRAKVERDVVAAPAGEKVWQTTLDNRVQESESGSMFDSEEVCLLQFDLDWIRVSRKARFRRAVSLEDKDGPKTDDKEAYSDELFEVYKEALLHKNELRSIFNYYGCKDGPMESDHMWQMTQSSWMLFCEEAQVLSDQRGCKKEDLQRIFAAVNFEEDDAGGGAINAENDANDDNKMLRFEFIEGIVRAAFGKFITSGLMKDASDAVRQFVKNEVLDRVPPSALLDPNKRNDFTSRYALRAVLGSSLDNLDDTIY